MPRIRLPIRLTAAFAAEDDHALLERFTDQRDETAFAALVGRHARMVYGVCKRAVRDEHLAEDAFQAVFLVLAKNPIGTSASVGGWLFGIARRVGLAARRHEERRQRREAFPQSPVTTESSFDDLLQVLDEELAQLPEEYRAPLVACFLEERTQDEAAKHLGWSLSTLRRRLDHGKELLRERLTRRGATMAGGLLASTFAPAAKASVPTHLLMMTTEPSALAKSLAAEAACGAVGVKLTFAALAFTALTALGIAVAGGDTPTPLTQSIPHADASPAPRAVERTPWVAVTGRVVFPEERDIPPLKYVEKGALKDAFFFGQAAPILDVVVDPRTRGIANAVVWLRPDTDDRKAAFPAERIHPNLVVAKPQDRPVFMSADGYTPRVVAARAGDRVVYENQTPIAFNLKYDRTDLNAPPMGEETGSFNMLLIRDTTHATKPLPALRFCDVVQDNIHPWIRGYVWAFDHPYFAVTDERGNFSIPNAPAGTWRLMIWHEKGGYRNGGAGRFGDRITINGDGKMDLGAVVHASPGWND